MKKLIAQLAMLLVALMPLTFISCDKDKHEMSEEELISKFVGNWRFNSPAVEYYVIKADYTCAYYKPHLNSAHNGYTYTKEEGTWILNNKECLMTFPSNAAKAIYDNLNDRVKINNSLAGSCSASDLPTVTESTSGRDELSNTKWKLTSGTSSWNQSDINYYKGDILSFGANGTAETAGTSGTYTISGNLLTFKGGIYGFTDGFGSKYNYSISGNTLKLVGIDMGDVLNWTKQ